jgi:hypothetical protein
VAGEAGGRRELHGQQQFQEVTMGEAAAAGRKRVIVIPRGLEDFFYDRLCRRYAGRSDVTILVDRRWGERRAIEHAVFPERRRRDRRHNDVAWALPEMPFDTQRPFSAS